MTKRQPPPGISDQDWKATPTSVQTAVYMLLRVVDELQQAVAQSQKRISQLEEQVGKNSRNSSMPPSSNPLNMKKPPAKVKEKRKAGGQPGHVGHDRPLKPPEEVDHFVVSKPISCQAWRLVAGEDPQPQRIRCVNCRPSYQK
ncbi:MAG: hypothetical protein IPK53_09680 [bacterium]|nr:hypothetical protein [bacterium]